MATEKPKKEPTTVTQEVIVSDTSQPKLSSRRAARRAHAKALASEVVPDVFEEGVSHFADFIRGYAVVGLAVGFIVGQQAQGLIKALVASFIDPLTNLFIGHKLSTLYFVITWHHRSEKFQWGLFVYTLIDFMFILAAVYAIIKFFNLDKLDKPKAK